LYCLPQKIFIQFLVAHPSTETQELDLAFNTAWKEELQANLYATNKVIVRSCRLDMNV
jgi:hypothetical protein